MLSQKAQSVLQDYEFHNRLIHRFVDGITHKESVLQLPFEHDCMNWILGYIVTNRSHVLETIGTTHEWQEDVQAVYHTKMPPVTPESQSIRFEILIKYLDDSVGLLEEVLENVSDDYLEELHTNFRGEKSHYGHITGFHWHESFHVGQLEILKACIESKRV